MNKQDWTYKKLGEVATFSRCLTYSKTDVVVESSNKVLRSNNIDLATVRDVCVDKEIDMETYVLVWKDESTVEFVRVNEYDNDNENIINFNINTSFFHFTPP